MITDNDYFYVNPDKIVGLTETSGTGNLEQLDGQPGLLVEYADSYLFMIFPAWSHEHVAEWVNV